MRHCLGLCLLVLGLTWPAMAQAQDASERLSAATERMAQGDERGAAEDLETLAADEPDAPVADDALFLAATLWEDHLGEPVRAAGLYQKIVDDYPDSRSALAAKRRLERLRTGLGEDDEGAIPLSRFSDILARFPERPHGESVRMAEELLDSAPSWQGRFRIHLWLAETLRSDGDLDAALDHFQQVLAGSTGSAERAHAALGAAELEMLRGHFEQARERASEVPDDAGPALEQARLDLQGRIADAENRHTLVQASAVLVLLMLVALVLALRYAAGSSGQALRALRVPPMELWYLAPFAALLSLMALTGHQDIYPAVIRISMGALLISYLSAVAIRERQPLSRRWALACALCAVIAAIAMCYLVLFGSQLLDLIVTTVRFGPE